MVTSVADWNSSSGYGDQCPVFSTANRDTKLENQSPNVKKTINLKMWPVKFSVTPLIGPFSINVPTL